MSDIKQKAREMFDLCGGIATINETPEEYRERVHKVLDSIIDLAIAERDKEIVEMMWQVREDWRNDGQIQALPTADYLINLITNSKE